MKKVFILLFGSLAVSAALSFWASVDLSIYGDALSTLYTVAGVVFSVGMSLAVSPKTDIVTNESMKKGIRSSYLRIRNIFMWLFCLDTVMFIVARGNFVPSCSSFFNILCCIFLLGSGVFYVQNFISLQRLGEQIEDQVLREKKNL